MMKQIVFEDYKFILYDGEERRILVDTNECLSNKSRFPMHAVDDSPDAPTIPNLILALKENHEKISLGTNEGSFAALLRDIIMTSYLIRTSVPMKVLELGATNGILSYHLAVLMGKLNPESSLCCVTNVMGSGSGNRWLDRISLVEQPPVLSLVVTEYEDTPLASDYFDIIIINGAEHFEKSSGLIREAERLLKKGGVLLCHVMNDLLLENRFKQSFPNVQEYEITPNERLFVTSCQSDAREKKPEPSLKAEIKEMVARLQKNLESGGSRDQYRTFIPEIERHIDKSISDYDIESKKNLIRLKQYILDYMLNMEGELGGYYKEKLESLQNKMLQES